MQESALTCRAVTAVSYRKSPWIRLTHAIENNYNTRVTTAIFQTEVLETNGKRIKHVFMPS